MSDRPIVILDTSSMLGSVARNAANDPIALELFSNVGPMLAAWRSRVRLGAVLAVDDGRRNPLPELLRANGVLDCFDRDLLLATSQFPARPANVSAPTMRVFASAGRAERSAAMDAGYRVVPHLVLVDEALAAEPLRYAQLRAKRGTGTIDDRIRDLPIVPVHRPIAERNTLYVVSSARTLDRLRALGPDVMWVKEYEHPADPAQGAPADTDLFFVHECLDASQEAAVFRDTMKRTVRTRWRVDDGLVLALDASQSIEDFHPPHDGCGRVRLLVPTRAVLREPEVRPFRRAEALRLATPEAARAPLGADAQAIIATLDATLIDDHWRGWAGKAPLPTGGPPIVSRHVNHPDNLRAVDALVATLRRIPGVETRKLDIRSHSRWFNVEGILRGANGREFVAVSAHLDAIALDSTKAAPGGDDDASGMAAVLAIATIMRKLVDRFGKPAREIRFLFFNAEERYMIGSNDYAVALTRTGTSSKPTAVIQLDMVGMPSTLTKIRTFELHPPGPDDFRTTLPPAVRERSLAVADLVERCGKADAKPYAIASPVKNGAKQDPLARRSDHSSFLLYGFPACAVTEDAFGGPTNPDPAFAKRYHSKADLAIDAEYTATIARAVAGALWTLANEGDAPKTETATFTATPNPRPTSLTEGAATTMPKTIMELVQDFADDQGVRCPILKDHVKGLEDYGVSAEAVAALGTMELGEIVPVLLTELTSLDINAARDLVAALEKKKGEFDPGTGFESGPVFEALAAAAGAYSSGGVHIFEVGVVNGGEPQVGVQTTFFVRGNGYDHGALLPEVRFVRPDKGEDLSDVVPAIVDSVRCDVDLSEYVTVRATLNKRGSWWVHIKNHDTDWATAHRDMNKIVVP